MPAEYPQFNTQTWWACMTYTRIRNLELVLRSHRDVVDRVPEDITALPKFEVCVQQEEDTIHSDTAVHGLQTELARSSVWQRRTQPILRCVPCL